MARSRSHTAGFAAAPGLTAATGGSQNGDMQTREERTAERAAFEARARALRATADDAVRCGHPKGPLRCARLTLCGECPFAEALEVDLAA